MGMGGAAAVGAAAGTGLIWGFVPGLASPSRRRGIMVSIEEAKEEGDADAEMLPAEAEAASPTGMPKQSVSHTLVRLILLPVARTPSTRHKQ